MRGSSFLKSLPSQRKREKERKLRHHRHRGDDGTDGGSRESRSLADRSNGRKDGAETTPARNTKVEQKEIQSQPGSGNVECSNAVDANVGSDRKHQRRISANKNSTNTIRHGVEQVGPSQLHVSPVLSTPSAPSIPPATGRATDFDEETIVPATEMGPFAVLGGNDSRASGPADEKSDKPRCIIKSDRRSLNDREGKSEVAPKLQRTPETCPLENSASEEDLESSDESMELIKRDNIVEAKNAGNPEEGNDGDTQTVQLETNEQSNAKKPQQNLSVECESDEVNEFEADSAATKTNQENDVICELTSSDVRGCIEEIKRATAIREADEHEDPFDDLDLEKLQSTFEEFEKYIEALGDLSSPECEELLRIGNEDDRAFSVFEQGIGINHCNLLFFWDMIQIINGGIDSHSESNPDHPRIDEDKSKQNNQSAKSMHTHLDHFAQCLERVFSVRFEEGELHLMLSSDTQTPSVLTVTISKLEEENKTVLLFKRSKATSLSKETPNLPTYLQEISQIFERFVAENEQMLQSRLDDARRALAITRLEALELQKQAKESEDELGDVKVALHEARLRQAEMETQLKRQKYEFEKREESFERVKDHYKAEINNKELELARAKQSYELKLEELMEELASVRSTPIGHKRKRQDPDEKNDKSLHENVLPLPCKVDTSYHSNNRPGNLQHSSKVARDGSSMFSNSSRHGQRRLSFRNRLSFTRQSAADPEQSKKKLKMTRFVRSNVDPSQSASGGEIHAHSKESKELSNLSEFSNLRAPLASIPVNSSARSNANTSDKKPSYNNIEKDGNGENSHFYADGLSNSEGKRQHQNHLADKNDGNNSSKDESSINECRKKRAEESRRLSDQPPERKSTHESENHVKNPYKKVGRTEQASCKNSNIEPGPFKYQEVVRGHDKRRALPGHECEHCKQFHDAICAQTGGDATFDRDQIVNECSRHRARHEPESTPPGFWEMSFADSIAARK